MKNNITYRILCSKDGDFKKYEKILGKIPGAGYFQAIDPYSDIWKYHIETLFTQNFGKRIPYSISRHEIARTISHYNVLSKPSHTKWLCILEDNVDFNKIHLDAAINSTPSDALLIYLGGYISSELLEDDFYSDKYGVNLGLSSYRGWFRTKRGVMGISGYAVNTRHSEFESFRDEIGEIVVSGKVLELVLANEIQTRFPCYVYAGKLVKSEPGNYMDFGSRFKESNAVDQWMEICRKK